MSETRKLRVFLCHSSQDKPIVRELYQRLSSEGWIDPWLDKEKLLPGQEWELEIEKSVEAADVVTVCLSKGSVGKEGYYQKEIKKILDVADEKPEGTIFIIPLRLEECNIPRRLAKWQYEDYFPEENRDKVYDRLLQSIKIRGNSLGVTFTQFIKIAEREKTESGLEQVEIKSQKKRKKSHDEKIVIPPVKLQKIAPWSHRANHHTALVSEKISQTSANGVNFVTAKLQWGKDDIGYSLHAEPTSYSTYGMQTTDFLAYLGFERESCSFATRKVCYANWIDSEFDLPSFAINFSEAFGLFEKATRLMEECGHFLYQPEGLEYFYPNAKRRAPRTKSGYGGDGHNANRIEDMKQTEDDDFFYRFSWIERTNSKGWVIHYRPKEPSNQDINSVLKFLDLDVFKECPQFEFEQCFWMFIEYQNRGDSFFEGNAGYAHKCFGAHENKFSSSAGMLTKANKLMLPFGFQFLKT